MSILWQYSLLSLNHNNMKIIKEIKKSPFKNLKRLFYFGKIIYGTPYFDPMNFVSTILFIRKLKLRTESEIQEYSKTNPFNKNHNRITYLNFQLVTRSKYRIVKLTKKHHFYVQYGYPLFIGKLDVGWKDKYHTPRFEWHPMFYIFIFKWQFVIKYVPDLKDNPFNETLYWEMYLWYRNYSDKDIEKAKDTWGWKDMGTKQCTWDSRMLKNN